MLQRQGMSSSLKMLVWVLCMVLLLPVLSSAKILYANSPIVMAVNGQGQYKILEQVEFDVSDSTSLDFYTLNDEETWFIEKKHLTTHAWDEVELVDNREFFDPQELYTSSLDYFTGNKTSYPGLHPDNPLYWARKGSVGPHAQAMIDGYQATGDFSTDVQEITNYILDLNLSYGGDTHKQIESLEENVTRCQGAAWLGGALLDKTNITYRFVTLWELDEPDLNTIPSVGHMRLEILHPDGSWREFDPTKLITSSASRSVRYESTLWHIHNQSLSSKVIFRRNLTPMGYELVLKSLAFAAGEVVHLPGERQLVPLY